MTFIVGYIYKKSVNLIADSAETVFDFEKCNIDPDNSDIVSTFFETPIQEERTLIFESALKIYNVSNRFIFTFAGSVNEGIKALSDLSSRHDSFDSLSDLFYYYFKSQKFKKTHYIIGYYEDEKPKLFFSYTDNRMKVVEEEIVVIFGGKNILGDARDFLEDFVIYALRNKFTIEETLVRNIAILQSAALVNQSIKVGVGGFFNGCTLDKRGVIWAPDTSYILYSAVNFNKGDMFRIKKFNRENGVIVTSETKCKIFYFGDERICQEYYERHKSDIELRAKMSITDYFVFLAYDKPTLIVFNNNISKTETLKISEGRVYLSKYLRSLLVRHKKNEANELHVYENFTLRRTNTILGSIYLVLIKLYYSLKNRYLKSSKH